MASSFNCSNWALASSVAERHDSYDEQNERVDHNMQMKLENRSRF